MINILIVDDDIATAEVIRDTVDWKKLTITNVYAAYHVSGAKKVLSEQRIDIVISDIEMPQETGLDLLAWVRREGMDCEFLLLTCHESFSYAANAISHNAAAYLTKPFDIDIMELNLQKIVTRLMEVHKQKKTSEYGAWMEKNLRFMKIDFWKSLLEGELTDENQMQFEIESRKLPINWEEEYCLVYSKITNIEADCERYGKDVLEFVLEGFHSEIVAGQVENENVVKYRITDALNYITVCKAVQRKMLMEQCERLQEIAGQYFKCTLTICISKPYEIMDFAKEKETLEELFGENLSFYGKSFLEENVETAKENRTQIIDLKKLVELVNQKNKAQILRYLKSIFDELSAFHNLNTHSLYLMKQEMIQVVYAELMNQGIQATKLFYDELSLKMAEQASQSTVDMVRWVNYLLGKTFDYEEEVLKSATIIEKIHAYIKEHYSEPIGRNEIAGEFYLTPEYLAKLYKKRTGQNLKDFIAEYRVERAKELLKNQDKSVSDIAEAVGFDNYSYFSTIFKKITGITPKEYRKG